MIGYRRAIVYSGYREGQSPILGVYPSYDEVKEDLLMIMDDYDIIRVYDASEHARIVLEVIRKEKMDLKVMLGMSLVAEYNNKYCPWMKQNYSEEELNEHKEKNEKELNNQIILANEYSDIVEFISAGNELRVFWGANLVTEERIIYFIKKLKENCKQLVTYSDCCDTWYSGQIEEIGNAVDFISTSFYPQWNRVAISDSNKYIIGEFEKVKRLWPDKDVVVSETGWTTDAPSDAIILRVDANCFSQKRYIDELTNWAKTDNVLVFIFEAFDELWKGAPGPDEPEKHWGLYDAKRQPKI